MGRETRFHSGAWPHAGARAALLFWLAASVAAAEGGKLHLQNYLPEEYSAHQQNWDVAQGADGVLYVANSEAILTFDGARWRPLHGPSGARFYAVHVGSDARVYAGGAGTIGFFEEVDHGAPVFVSLLPHAEGAAKDFHPIRWIEETTAGVFFLATDCLFGVTRTGEVHVWPLATSVPGAGPAAKFRQLATADDHLLVAVSGVGLLRLDGDELAPMNNTEELALYDIGGIAKHPEGLLIATFANGLFLYDGGAVRPLPGAASDAAAEGEVMGLSRLPSGDYALSTLSSGVILVDAAGRIVRRIDQQAGLNDNSVLNSGLRDATGGLWLPLNSGIARVDVESPLEYFDESSELAGTVVRMTQHGDATYAATSQGLFRLSSPERSGELARWTRIAGAPNFCWDLVSFGSQLAVATSDGLFVHDSARGNLRRISDLSIHSLALDSAAQRIWAATPEHGLLSFTIDGSTLRPESAVEGVQGQLRRVVLGPSGDLWLSAVRPDRTEDLVRVRGGRSLDEPSSVRTYGTRDGLPAGDQFQPFVWRRQLWVGAIRTGLFRFAPDSDRFEIPEAGELRTVAGDGVEQSAVESDDTIWLSPAKGTAVRLRARDDATGTFEVDRPLAADRALTLTALLAQPGVLWAATGDGRILRYLERDAPEPLIPHPKLRALFSSPERPELSVRRVGRPAETELEIPFEDRSVRIEFALPSFNRPTSNSFQFRMRGLDEEWSAWTYETYRDYPGLREGNYRFDLRARDVHGRATEVSSIHFRVLPPWYRTPWAYLAFASLAGVLLWGGVSLRQRSTERRLGLLHDEIARRERVERALRRSDERYRAFIRQSLEGMARFELEPPLSTDAPVAHQVERIHGDAIVAECNQAFARMYGGTDAAEIVGSRLADLSMPPGAPGDSWVAEFVARGYQYSDELTELDREGRERDFQRTATGIVEGRRLVRVWSTQRDIEQRKQQEKRLSYLASFDALTDLPNRFLFEDRMKQGLARARRFDRRLAVHYLDLDNFKNVNDTMGHSVGDELLSAVARRLKETVRESDTVARLGGDEFAIIQPSIETPHESVVALAEKIIVALARPFELSGHEIHTGASIGISVSTSESQPAALMTQADTALHKAKDAGRGVYRFHSAEMAREVQAYVDLARDLRHAIERDEFFLEFQPLVRLDSGRCVGLEALLRWQHPELGRLLPGVFISVAESSGLITQIGEWVLAEACRRSREWWQAAVGPVPVSVNLSAVQFKHPKLGQRILETLSNAHVEPSMLELELTETTLMSSQKEVARTLDTLREHGIRFAIDDFGTGYSSLQYVSSFPVSKLKIAMEFVRGLVTQPRSRAIVEAVINLGNALGVDVLAEGIETEEQASVLRRRGCELAQGFLFSRPIAADAVVDWLAAQARAEDVRR